MEATLERLVAADQGDFASKRKLRLLRTVRHLCREGVVPELAVVLLGRQKVDAILYAVLGNANTEQASLFSMADPRCSPVCHCVDALTKMLCEWGQDVDAWLLL